MNAHELVAATLAECGGNRDYALLVLAARLVTFSQAVSPGFVKAIPIGGPKQAEPRPEPL